jgi:TPR repeat protein
MTINPIEMRMLCQDLYERAAKNASERHGKMLAVDFFFAAEQWKKEHSFQGRTYTFIETKNINDLVKIYTQACVGLTEADQGIQKPLALLGFVLVNITQDLPLATRASAKVAQMHFAGTSNPLKDAGVWLRELFRSLFRIFSKLPQKQREDLYQKVNEFERESVTALVNDKPAEETTRAIQQKLAQLRKDIATIQLPEDIEKRVNEEINSVDAALTCLSKPVTTTSSPPHNEPSVSVSSLHTSFSKLCEQKSTKSGKTSLKNAYARYIKNPNDKDLVDLMYLLGKEIKNDDRVAFTLLLEAAKAGSAKAMYYVGRMQERSIGTKQDIVEAENWYTKAIPLLEEAADANHETKFILALMYKDGLGCKKNQHQAYIAILEAAYGGSPEAAYLMCHDPKYASSDLLQEFFPHISPTLQSRIEDKDIAAAFLMTLFLSELKTQTDKKEEQKAYAAEIRKLMSLIFEEGRTQHAAGDKQAAWLLHHATEKAPAQETKWLKRARKIGNFKARILYDSKSIQAASQKAMKLISKACTKADAFGLYEIGVAFGRKLTIKSPEEKIGQFVALMEEAIKAGSVNAAITLRNFYRDVNLIERASVMDEIVAESLGPGFDYLREIGIIW